MLTIIFAAALAQSGPVLWDKVEAGMSVDAVRAIYPADGKSVIHNDSNVEIEGWTVIPGCKAQVNVFHKSGVVERVLVKGDMSLGGKCSDKVSAALAGKYGQPATSESGGRGILSAGSTRTLVWSMPNGTSLTLKQTGPKAGKIGAARWTAEYTATPQAIGL